VKRRLFNLLAVVSLVLSLAVVILWIRSCFAQDNLYLSFANSSSTRAVSIGLGSEQGCIGIGRNVMTCMNATLPEQFDKTKMSFETYKPGRVEIDPSGFWPALGFDWRTGGFQRTRHGGKLTYEWATLTLPYWLFVIIGLVLPACFWLRRLQRRNRQRLLLCTVCGYGLRASKDRCPEFGTAIGAIVQKVVMDGSKDEPRTLDYASPPDSKNWTRRPLAILFCIFGIVVLGFRFMGLYGRGPEVRAPSFLGVFVGMLGFIVAGILMALSAPNGRASKDRCPECGRAIPAAAAEPK
jgi:hypothetical protein